MWRQESRQPEDDGRSLHPACRQVRGAGGERPPENQTPAFPGGTADLARCEVRHSDGTRDPLSEREIAVLRYLAAHPGRALSRGEILLRVWRLPASAGATRTIDMHVANLRAKLRDDPTNPQVIPTVRGKGYVLAKLPSPGSRLQALAIALRKL